MDEREIHNKKLKQWKKQKKKNRVCFVCQEYENLTISTDCKKWYCFYCFMDKNKGDE